jgi:hypothetical protein
MRIALGGIGFAPEMIARDHAAYLFILGYGYFVMPDGLCGPREAIMTAYLISLSLAGVVAIVAWEGFS